MFKNFEMLPSILGPIKLLCELCHLDRLTSRLPLRCITHVLCNGLPNNLRKSSQITPTGAGKAGGGTGGTICGTGTGLGLGIYAAYARYGM